MFFGKPSVAIFAYTVVMKRKKRSASAYMLYILPGTAETCRESSCCCNLDFEGSDMVWTAFPLICACFAAGAVHDVDAVADVSLLL